MTEQVKQKWIVEGEDRTHAAFGSLKKNVSGVDRSFGDLGNKIKNALGPVAAALTVGALAHAVDSAADSLDDLAERSRQLGFTSADLDAWRYAAELGGVSADEFDAGAAKMAASMKKAADAADYSKTPFGELGIEVRNAAGDFRLIPDVMLDMADAIAAVEDPVKRVGLAREMFGRGGERFVTVTEDGSTAIREWLAEAYAMGVRTDALTKKGEQFNDGQQRMNRSLRATGDAIYSAALPALTSLAEVLSVKVLNAVTGVDEEYRKLIGHMYVMPGEQALAAAAEKEAELLARRERLLRENADASVDWGMAAAASKDRTLTGGFQSMTQMMGALVRHGKSGEWAAEEIAEINRQLLMLKDLQTDIKARTEAAASADKELGDELERDRVEAAAASEAERKLSEMRRDAERVIRAQMSASDLLAEQQDRLNDLLEAGMITTDQYARAMRELTPEIERAAKAENELAERAEKANNSAEETYSGWKRVGLDAVDQMHDAFEDFFDFNEEGFLDLGRLAESVADDIAEAFTRNMIINPMLQAVTSAITGNPTATGGSSTIGTGYNDSRNKAMAGSLALTEAPVNVQVTIHAVDAPSVQQLLIGNKGLITGLVQAEYTKRGLPGPRGLR